MKRLEGTNTFIAERDFKDNGITAEITPGKWAIARPIGYIDFWYTLQCALKVLKHQADIVVWKQYEIKK